MKKFINNYGMIFILGGLCILFSFLTLKEQTPNSKNIKNQFVEKVQSINNKDITILSVGGQNTKSAEIAKNLEISLKEEGFSNTFSVVGTPADLKYKLKIMMENLNYPDFIIMNKQISTWNVLGSLKNENIKYQSTQEFYPKSYLFPDFLKKTNLIAIVDRIVVIAILAIGMTFVIITGGIDLSVGSLIAVSAVVGTSVMKSMGGVDASSGVVFIGFMIGILSTVFIGGLGGFVVAFFKVPSFITTLAIMLIGRGLAFMITDGFSIYRVPQSLTWLGQASSFGLPNTVIFLIILYLIAHFFLSKTKIGRYIYAVGGNEEAARLSGVPVNFIKIFVFLICGFTAGLGGCIQASQLNSGTPNMGIMYELYVIAAVVVGGTTLSGGSGKILGTLIGVFVISVIQNGMNLIGIESYTQQVVLGLVILIAVVIDKSKSNNFFGKYFNKRG
tara:strand:- start:1439 stop:2773 length:1335 start_codon:yes stop_codon:yes gene_type:complete